MRIALAQLSSLPDREANLERAVAAVDAAAAQGAEVVVFPEIVLDRFFPAVRCGDASRHPAAFLAETIPGPTTERLAAKARQHRMVVVFNLYERDADGRTFDSSPVIDADGTLLGVTRMVHICDYPGFHERDYYRPGDTGAPVYATRAGRIGVAICYDRHYPEYMRALAAGGAELVLIPQAGALGEWPEGLFEAEVRTAAFQNGYFAALCNRVGVEDQLTFAGESFVVDPEGRVLARGKRLEEDLVVAGVDLARCAGSPARRLFWPDRRPELYPAWVSGR
ncbi:MAG: carbon-nitrogen hydrolase family protein [Acidobacteria bacterium]|nr:MAG: carbon-nitrogen hydrolase family protein [Acidobacteriota bacterium]